MKESIYLERFDEYVDPSLISFEMEEGKWRALPYRGNGRNGVALFAGPCNNVKPLEIDPKLTGPYKIYVCFGGRNGKEILAEIGLSDEKGQTIFRPCSPVPIQGYWAAWGGYEVGEESFYRIADMTGKKLTINRPYRAGGEHLSFILYFRFEKMTEEEYEEYQKANLNKVIQYHFDNDYFMDCEYKTPEDYAGRVALLAHGNGDMLIEEIGFDDCGDDFELGVSATGWQSKEHEKYWKKYFAQKKEVNAALAAKAHELGMTIYGGTRMQAGDFTFPQMSGYANDGINKKYPEFRCYTRTGRPIEALSYAYPETRKYITNKILGNLPDTYDGVSLFFHRGLMIAFEQPVLDEVEKRYGVNARRLPISDPRLHTVWGEFMTQFMREFKAATVEKAKKEGKPDYKINVVVYHDLESSVNMGYDVETWVKEGLVDSVSQGLMSYYEKLDNVMAEDGLIDLAKYESELEHDYLMRRNYDDVMDHIIAGIPALKEICDTYGVDFYGALAWENKDAQYQFELAKRIYALGVKKLLCWNANHIATKLSVLDTIRKCGDKEKLLSGKVEIEKKVFRITQIDGNDISDFDPNWRG